MLRHFKKPSLLKDKNQVNEIQIDKANSLEKILNQAIQNRSTSAGSLSTKSNKTCRKLNSKTLIPKLLQSQKLFDSALFKNVLSDSSKCFTMNDVLANIKREKQQQDIHIEKLIKSKQIPARLPSTNSSTSYPVVEIESVTTTATISSGNY